MRVRAAYVVPMLVLALGSQEVVAQQAGYVAPRRGPINTAVTLAPVTDAMLRNPDPGDWLMFRRTYEGQSYSPLDQVNRTNVRNLQLVWSWGIEKGASPNVDDWVGPIVQDGVMFLNLPGGVVHTLDAATGEFLWQFRQQMAEEYRGDTGGIRGGLALYGDKAYITPADGKLVAINTRDGSKAWESVLSEGNGPTSSGGLAVAGKIISGVAGGGGGEGTGTGGRSGVAAHDAATGQKLWEFHTTAFTGEQGGDTWGGLPDSERGGGSGNPWITGTYDPNLNLTYWSASQAKPWHRISRGTGDAELLYTSATMALDPATGKLAWHYQYIPGESFDMDEHYAFINVDVPGLRRPSGFLMGKSGVLWHVDRETGQLIRANDTGLQNIMEVDPEKGFVRYRPELMAVPSGQPAYTCPSTSGFKTQREMAYNPQTQAFYIPMSLNCSDRVYTAREMVPGGGAFGGSPGGTCCRVNKLHPDYPGMLGQVLAMDVNGKQLWAHRQASSISSAAMTTAGGVVFVGDTDRYVYAFDTQTGDILWRSPRLATKISGFPVTYTVDGRQYLAIVTGVDAHNWISTVARELAPQSHWPQAGMGVFVFALPQAEE